MFFVFFWLKNAQNIFNPNTNPLNYTFYSFFMVTSAEYAYINLFLSQYVKGVIPILEEEGIPI